MILPHSWFLFVPGYDEFEYSKQGNIQWKEGLYSSLFVFPPPSGYNEYKVGKCSTALGSFI